MAAAAPCMQRVGLRPYNMLHCIPELVTQDRPGMMVDSQLAHIATVLTPYPPHPCMAQQTMQGQVLQSTCKKEAGSRVGGTTAPAGRQACVATVLQQSGVLPRLVLVQPLHDGSCSAQPSVASLLGSSKLLTHRT